MKNAVFLFTLFLLFLLLSLNCYPQMVPAEITDVTPDKGKVGDTVIITGTGFGLQQGSVLFGEAEATVISWSDTRIMAAISLNSSSGTMKVVVPSITLEHPFTVIPSWNVYPSPTNTFLTAVGWKDAHEAWLMEKTGQGEAYYFNGKVWELSPNNKSGCISDILFLPDGDGWAVGGNGTILQYKYKQWEKTATALTRENLNDLSFISPTDGWAVGDTGTIIHYYDWTVHDISWRKDNSGIFDPLYAVEFISSEKGWAMGKDGVILEYNKKKWVKIASPAGSVIYSMDFASSNNGWAVGANGTILQYNGRAWVLYPSPVQVNLYCVYLVEDNDGWIVGEGGLIMHYNGNIWEKIDSPTTINLYDLDFRSQDDGWAVGEEGIILRYH